MKKMMIFLVILLATGCVQDNTQSTYDLREDKAGRDLLTEDDGVRHGDGPNFVRDPDDDMSVTDQNPNLLNTDNENRHNYSLDVQKAKEVISAKGFKPGQIWINGGNMNVTIDYNGRMTRKQYEKTIKSLHDDLTQALPRYDVSVKIE